MHKRRGRGVLTTSHVQIWFFSCPHTTSSPVKVSHFLWLLLLLVISCKDCNYWTLFYLCNNYSYGWKLASKYLLRIISRSTWAKFTTDKKDKVTMSSTLVVDIFFLIIKSVVFRILRIFNGLLQTKRCKKVYTNWIITRWKEP